MKNSLTLPPLAKKNFSSLKDENDESIHNSADRFLRNFVPISNEGGRCIAFNQHFKSDILDEVCDNVSKKLNNNCNICDPLEFFFEFLNKDEKLCSKEFDSKYADYRVINQKENAHYINNELNLLPLHERLSKLDLNITQMDFDATSLYPSAMWESNSICPKLEVGYAFKPQMKNLFVGDLIIKVLIQMVMTQQF